MVSVEVAMDDDLSAALRGDMVLDDAENCLAVCPAPCYVQLAVVGHHAECLKEDVISLAYILPLVGYAEAAVSHGASCTGLPSAAGEECCVYDVRHHVELELCAEELPQVADDNVRYRYHCPGALHGFLCQLACPLVACPSLAVFTAEHHSRDMLCYDVRDTMSPAYGHRRHTCPL